VQAASFSSAGFFRLCFGRFPLPSRQRGVSRTLGSLLGGQRPTRTLAELDGVRIFPPALLLGTLRLGTLLRPERHPRHCAVPRSRRLPPKACERSDRACERSHSINFLTGDCPRYRCCAEGENRPLRWFDLVGSGCAENGSFVNWAFVPSMLSCHRRMGLDRQWSSNGCVHFWSDCRAGLQP
jgi:hypothetical protein